MKRCHIKYTIVFLLLLSLLLSALPSCQRSPREYDTSWFEYFDCFSQLTAYAQTQEEFDEYANVCESILTEYHQLLDIYHEYDGITNLKTINQISPKESIAIDEKLGEFLAFGKEMHQLTNGYTNMAMGSVLSLWHTARETKTLPDENVLLTANEHVDINDLLISEDLTSVQKLDPELQIDAGAIGKGFVAKKIANELTALGCESFLLNLGGNLLGHGTKSQGDAWHAGIENPLEGGLLDYSVNISDLSLVTSGSYYRYFYVGETKYHHIIHPKTLTPENYYLSVSILCPDSAVADALSTALFSMSVEEGKKILAQREDVEALWLFPDGSVHMTDGFMDHVQTEKK